jgi:hypothetical protein
MQKTSKNPLTEQARLKAKVEEQRREITRLKARIITLEKERDALLQSASSQESDSQLGENHPLIKHLAGRVPNPEASEIMMRGVERYRAAVDAEAKVSSRLP